MIKDNTQQKTLKQNNKFIRWALIGLETLFLALTALYLFYATTQITTFALTWPNGFIDKLLPVMAVVAGLRLLTTRLLRWRTLIALGLALIYCLVYRSTKYQFLLYLAVLTVGLIDIDYRKILKVYLISTGVVYCAAVLAGMMGVITNYVYVNAGRGFRSAWGICYPTDFASKGFFLLLALWVVCKKLPDWAMLFPCAGFVLLARYIAFSWNSTICSIVFFCTILWCILERRVIDRHPKLGWVRKGTNLFETCAFPLFALAMFALMLIYARGMNIGYRLDNLLSRRLQLGVQAWQKHGLNAFGKRFSQNGNGFSTFPNPKYNFIDSTYPLILLRYGWVLFLAIIGFWGWMARRAAQSGDRRLLLVLGIIAFHSFAEHHFIECEYNVLLAMPLAAFPKLTAARRTAKRADRIPMIAHAVTVVASIAVLWLIAPAVLSGIRTVLEYRGLTGSKGGWSLFFIALGILVFAGITVWAVDRLLKAALSQDRRQGFLRSAAALVACALIGFGGWLYAGHTISAAAEANAEWIETDRKALEIAARAATGKVYSGVLPSAYHDSVEGVSYSRFFEDDLARNIGDTFLIPNKTERAVFLNSGSLYVEISDQHALYTGDRAVVEALTEAGYHATGYYSTVREVSSSRAAKLNHLTYDEENGIRLSGKRRSLTNGPYYDLYAGKYTVTYELTLPEGEPQDDSVVCTLSVTAEKGKDTLLEKEITGNQFDEDGILTASIPLSIWDRKDVGMSAKANKGKRVIIRSVRYTRTPDLDTHRFYDAKYRVVREEYYDRDGRPVPQSGGYYCFEQDYDQYGNVTARRFFDANGSLSLRSDGYAEVRWDYDAKKQVIRESFYDSQGKPVMITSRQAANERVYDEAGNVVVWRYLDTEGKPVVTTSNYAELRREYNEKRQIIREEYIGANGEPLIQTSGYSGMEQDYDDAGNVIARRFFDSEGPVLRTDGYAEVRWEYNGLHQIIRETFYGVNGEPVMTFDGYAADVREYDTTGNVIVYRYYDEHGEPTCITAVPFYSEVYREYNDKRWIIREEYRGSDGQPMLVYGGYASLERDYNEQGSVKAQRHYGLSGEPLLIDDGYFEVRREYDEAGHGIRETYYDTNGVPITCTKGYAEIRRSYNDFDQLTEETFFTVDGVPAVVGVGYTRVYYEYTEDRQLSLVSYLDSDGETVQAGSGYLHAYLQSLFDKDLTVFISAKDEVTNGLTVTIIEDLKGMGLKTDLRGKYRNSFLAVITPDGVCEEIGAQKILSKEGMVGNKSYTIISAGFQVGNYSSIIINGVEYSKNHRGLNIIVYDNGTKQVIDSVAFDTHLQEMTVYR